MTEKEYFRKNYPDSCYGDKPLSPYFDFFQDGVEFGERESEKKIVELKLKLEALEGQTPWKDIKDKSELIKENAELKERVKILEQIKQEHTDYTIKVEQERTLVKEQLTKAKELLKQWLSLCGFKVEKLSKDTEQFLKEINE